MVNLMRQILSLSVFALIMMLMAGCNDSSSSSDTERESITVGRYMYSGDVESLQRHSTNMASAMALARDNVNDNGGLLTDFDLGFADRSNDCGFNEDDNEQNRQKLSELVDEENVIAVLGPECSGTAQTVLSEIAIPAGVVALSAAATRPGLLEEDSAEDLFFRTILAEDIAGERMAQALIDDENINTVAFAGNEGSASYRNGLERVAEDNEQLTISATAIYDEDSDPAKFIEDLKSDAGAADALVIFGFDTPEALPIFTVAVNGNEFDTIYVADGLVTNIVLESNAYELSDLTDKYRGVRGANSNEAARAAFVALTEGTDLDPDALYVASAYDAAFALALAIEQSGNQRRDSVAAALRSVVTGDDNSTVILPGEWEKAVLAIGNGNDILYHGVSAELEFDQTGDIYTVSEVVTISDSGEFERVRMVE